MSVRGKGDLWPHLGNYPHYFGIVFTSSESDPDAAIMRIIAASKSVDNFGPFRFYDQIMQILSALLNLWMGYKSAQSRGTSKSFRFSAIVTGFLFFVWFFYTGTVLLINRKIWCIYVVLIISMFEEKKNRTSHPWLKHFHPLFSVFTGLKYILLFTLSLQKKKRIKRTSWIRCEV